MSAARKQKPVHSMIEACHSGDQVVLETLGGQIVSGKVTEKTHAAGRYYISLESLKGDGNFLGEFGEDEIKWIKTRLPMVRATVRKSRVPVDQLLEGITRGFPSIAKFQIAVYKPSNHPDEVQEEVPPRVRTVNLLASDIRPNFELEAFAERIPLQPHEVLGLCSIVLTEQGMRHLFMIDFNELINPDHLEKSLYAVESCVKSLGQTEGYLLRTKNTLHFYGLTELLDEDSWCNIMYEAMEMQIVGEHYTCEHVARRFYVLRLNACQSGVKTDSPQLVGTIGIEN